MTMCRPRTRSTCRSTPSGALPHLLALLLAVGSVGCAGPASSGGGGEAPGPRAGPVDADSVEVQVPEPEGNPRQNFEVNRERVSEGDSGAPEGLPGGVLLDTVQAGRFDNGKMWTFEAPPIDYLEETYGFRPDSAWFRSARLGALRIPGCSASFVSPHGLVMTNHHCARESVTGVERQGERLLDEGFYARSLQEERRVEELHADRLEEIRDVTQEVDRRLEGAGTEERSELRSQVLDSIETAVLEELGGEDSGFVVETISLYNGGLYSAYIFRRFDDVRLVMAPELQVGFFGGDPDNFTYPRYNLDVAFLRVYGEDGEPFEPEVHFPWSSAGVEEGDLTFVVGNPGSTSRLQTVAELEFRRDVSDRQLLTFVRSRIEVLEEFVEERPELADSLDLRNTVFSLENTEKSYEGMIRGLHDPVILKRRVDSQESFRDSIRSRPELRSEYEGLFEEVAELQEQKREKAPAYGAFLAVTSEDLASATLQRALFAQQLLGARARGIPEEALEPVKERILGVSDQPPALDEALAAARFRDLIRAYGEESEIVERTLQGRTPEGLAAVIRDASVLTDSARTAAAVEDGSLSRDDPAVRAVAAYFPAFLDFQQMLSGISAREEEIAAQLGRARFEVFGTSVPPDATFSLRIADGVVEPYEYNGTRAPVVTTFHGLYDRYHAHGKDTPWELPDRWVPTPEGLDLSTPLNFISTADIIGGNSGSPVIDRNLEVVGLVFDGNIESLTGDYIYLPESARAVSVDARGILEALREVYGMERLVRELTEGVLAPAGAVGEGVR